jgi:acyl-CoA synthetase (AMP-forming)/AMP-acid ligase II
MISHRNIIANVLQQSTYESVGRGQKGVKTQAITGFLPFSHIFALVVACHSGTWRGDEVIILPKFDFKASLAAIQRFKIEQLFVVSLIALRVGAY